MRRIVVSVAIGLLALGAAAGIADGQQVPVPQNQIMPRLPPLPEPAPSRPSVAPCKLSQTTIPKGDTVPATRAEQMPGGIGLYGSEESPDRPHTGKMPPCVQPG